MITKKEERSRRKIEMRHTENIITTQMTFSKCLSDVFKEADALERVCNVEMDIVIFPSTGPPYVFSSSRFERRVKRFRSPDLRKRRYLSSLKQARIFKKQIKLNRLKEELKKNKECGKVSVPFLIFIISFFTVRIQLHQIKKMFRTFKNNFRLEK